MNPATAYAPLESISIIVSDANCTIAAPSNFDLPQGGRTLPMSFNFKSCYPLKAIDVSGNISNASNTSLPYDKVVYTASNKTTDKQTLTPSDMNTNFQVTFSLTSLDSNATIKASAIKLYWTFG